MLRPFATGLLLCALAPPLAHAEPGAGTPVVLDSGWEYRASGVPFHGWFRVRLPAGDWEDPSVLFEDLESDFVARLDGREFAASRPPPGGFVLPGWGWRILRLPEGYAGRVLELELAGSTAVATGPEDEVRIGSRGDLLLQVARSHFDELVFAAACLLLGLAAFAVALWWEDARIHAALAFYALCAGVTIFSLSPLRLFLWDSPSGWHYALWAGRFGASLGLVVFTWVLFGRPFRFLRWFCGALGVVGAAVAALLAARQRLGFELGWRFLNIEQLAAMVLVLGVVLLAIRQKVQGSRPFLVGLALLFLGGFLSTAVAYGLLPRTLDFHGLGQLGFLLVLGKLAVDRVAFAYRSLREKNLELGRAQAELTAAVRARDEFLSVAAHELRTPIATLNLQVEVLGRQMQDPRRVPALELLRRQIDRLHRLAVALLDVTRAGEKQFMLDLQPLELSALLREVVQRHEYEAARVGSKLELELPGAVYGLWDRLRLDQVLTNLLSNALKFGAGQPIRVSLGVEGGEARLAVTDHGIGIPRERQEAIFERFERAVSTRNYPGLGLGLWIARELARAHGGTLRVHSEIGHGSSFTLRLPGASTVKDATG